MEDLATPVLLNGFVLRLRTSEVLLTFPELLELPEGLESEAQATVRYSNGSGRFAAIGRVVRVAVGPPVTVTLKRLVPLLSDPRRPPVQPPVAGLPVSIQIVKSRVAAPNGLDGMQADAESINAAGMLLKTSVLLAVGDTVRLTVANGSAPVNVQGRVIRVFECEGNGQGHFGVGIDVAHESDAERARWLKLVAGWRKQQAG